MKENNRERKIKTIKNYKIENIITKIIDRRRRKCHGAKKT